MRIAGMLAFCLALGGAAKGAAQTPEEPKKVHAGPHAELEIGAKPVVRISQGPLGVSLRLIKMPREGRAPVATVTVNGAKALELGAGMGPSATHSSHIRILTLDKSADLPQAVFSRYTGGAHCCSQTRIATRNGGKWSIVEGTTRDGEEGYNFEDILKDGTVELTGADNRFLYRFDSYAASYAPPQIYELRGTKLVDVTREEKYRPWLRAELAKQEKEAGEYEETWKSNGFLAGWVAHKALIGEQADAWPRMLKLYNRDYLWGVSECDGVKPPAKCTDPGQMGTLFPIALRAFLVQSGYLAADDAASR